jgi:hypothetical protein
MDIEADMDISLSGSSKKPIINTDINLKKANFEIPNTKDNNKKDEKPFTLNDLPIGDTKIVAKLFGNNNIWISENNRSLDYSFNIEAQTDINILIENELETIDSFNKVRKIAVNGYFQALRGNAKYKDKQLRLNEGRISINTSKTTIDDILINMDKYLDINIDTEIRINLYLINLQLKKINANTDFNLYSDPPLSKVDIISVIATGKTLDEIKSEKAPKITPQYAMQFAEDFTYDFMNKLLLGKITDFIKDWLNLQDFEIKLPALDVKKVVKPASEMEEDAKTELKVGKYVTNKLYLKYSYSIEEFNESKFKRQFYGSEYYIDPKWTLKLDKIEFEDFTTTLQYKIRF